MIGIGRWSILNRCYEDQRPFPFRYRRIARTRRRKSGAHGSAQTRRGRSAEPVARRRSLARLQRSSGSQRWWTLAATSFRRLARAQTTRTGRPEASATCSGRGPPVSGWARSGSSWLRTARCLCSTIPPSSRPRILRSWKSGLSRTHQTSLPERDHDSVINDVITQNASNKSSIQLISRASGESANFRYLSGTTCARGAGAQSEPSPQPIGASDHCCYRLPRLKNQAGAPATLSAAVTMRPGKKVSRLT